MIPLKGARIVAAVLTLMCFAPAALAQEPAPPPPPPKPERAAAPPVAASPVTALMAEITISRHKGDTVVSSVPYAIGVLPDNSRATLRVGGQVPVPTGVFIKGADGKEPSSSSFSYRNIGTDIDVQASPAQDGRYRLGITIDESSVYPQGGAAGPEPVTAPAFRSFRTSNMVMLKHGQRIEYVAATDRISGEVTRIAVRLTVVP